MKRVLLTGMSGTGKSAVIRELAARGYKAIDGDDGWPILHDADYLHGHLRVLTIPENFSDLSSYPQAVLDSIRRTVGEALPVKLEAPVLPDDVIVAAEGMRFYVSGEVKTPGRYLYEKGLTVNKAISMAGGLNKFAGTRLLILRHGKNNQLRRIPIQWTRIAGGEHQEENIAVLPGDTLFVP